MGCDPFGGQIGGQMTLSLNSLQPSVCQIFTLRFVTVAKLQLWRRNEDVVWFEVTTAWGIVLWDLCIGKVENHWPKSTPLWMTPFPGQVVLGYLRNAAECKAVSEPVNRGYFCMSSCTAFSQYEPNEPLSPKLLSSVFSDSNEEETRILFICSSLSIYLFCMS